MDRVLEDRFQPAERQHKLRPDLRLSGSPKQCILNTDARNYRVRALLFKMQKGRKIIIAHYSKTLTFSECNYYVADKELLTVIRVIKHFWSYLYEQEFFLQTDHVFPDGCAEKESLRTGALKVLADFRYTLNTDQELGVGTPRAEVGKPAKTADSARALSSGTKACHRRIWLEKGGQRPHGYRPVAWTGIPLLTRWDWPWAVLHTGTPMASSHRTHASTMVELTLGTDGSIEGLPALWAKQEPKGQLAKLQATGQGSVRSSRTPRCGKQEAGKTWPHVRLSTHLAGQFAGGRHRPAESCWMVRCPPAMQETVVWQTQTLAHLGIGKTICCL